MADLTITAASVVAVAGATIDTARKAGETVTAGQAVYLDTSDNEWKLADASASATAAASGITLNGASDGQPVHVATAGSVTIGATLVLGTVYVVSATAGGIAPDTDILITEYLTILGAGSDANTLVLGITATGAQHA